MNQLPFAGLTSVEAAARLKSHGFNELPAAERRGVFRIAFEVVRQPMFALLIAGGRCISSWAI
jgi:Ca2+-transporting ATPase